MNRNADFNGEKEWRLSFTSARENSNHMGLVWGSKTPLVQLCHDLQEEAREHGENDRPCHLPSRIL